MRTIRSSSTLTRRAAAVISALLLVFSLVTIASKARSTELLSYHEFGNSISRFELSGYIIFLASYPARLAPALAELVLTTACSCLIVALTFLFGTIKILRREKALKLSKFPWLLLLPFLGAVTILAFASMITLIIQIAQSTHFSLRNLKEHLDGSDQLDDGIYELGTWACETKVLPSFADSDLAEQCGLSWALRVSIIVQFLSMASLLALFWWVRRGHRNLFEEIRYVPDGYGGLEIA